MNTVKIKTGFIDNKRGGVMMINNTDIDASSGIVNGGKLLINFVIKKIKYSWY